jgi:N-methylhydantoinase A
MVVYPARALTAIEKELCAPLGIDLFQAAAGILDIVNANMMGAVRVISVEQGEDARDFALVAFGGAGPLHAADIARAMGIAHVIVPPRPGLLSALGLLHAEVRGDFSLTRFLRAEAPSVGAVNAGFAQLRAQAEAWLQSEIGPDSHALYEWSIDLRYAGQNFELTLPCESGNMPDRALEHLVQAFHERHREFYGYDMPGLPVEIVNLRLTVSAARPEAPLERMAGGGNVVQALAETRSVWFPDTGFVNTPVYKRALLPPGTAFDGPLVVEQMDATTVVPPKFRFRVDTVGAIHLELPPAERTETMA